MEASQRQPSDSGKQPGPVVDPGTVNALPEVLALHPEAKVLATHPLGIVALEKPPGVLSHPNQPEDRDNSLIRADYDLDQRAYSGFAEGSPWKRVFLVHRLDSATSGVILVCTNPELYPILIDSFSRGRVNKVYHAIVRGRPAGIPRIWIDRLERLPPKGGRPGPIRMRPGGGVPARTDQVLLRMDENRLGLALVMLKPITGRTHQLRVQCTSRGHPILGDRNYGDFTFNRRFAGLPYAKRLFLHSSSIELDFVVGGVGQAFVASSPLPPAFEQMLGPNKDLQQLIQSAPKSAEAMVKRQRRRIKGGGKRRGH